jgi:ribonuclease BN (tRNA processing enzyme)
VVDVGQADARVGDIDERKIGGARGDIDLGGLEPRLILRGAQVRHWQFRSVEVVHRGHTRGIGRTDIAPQARLVILFGAAVAILAGTPRAAAEVPSPQGSHQGLELLVLGSGGPAALGRASSSYLVLLDGGPRVLVDAGPGSFARAGEAHAELAALDVVLLTHLHVDHAAELPGFVKARAVSSGQPIHFDIYGPGGRAAQEGAPAFPSTSRFIRLLFGADGAFAYLKDFSAPVSFSVTDLTGLSRPSPQPRTILRRGDLAISAVAGHHGDAPAVIYRIDCRGHSVVFSGDIDAQGLPALTTIARGANLLVFDAVVLDPPGSPEVLYTLHTPPKAIGTLAAAAQVGALLLSHLSPAVEGDRAAVTASIASHYRGTVQFATDGMRLQP